MQQACLPQQKVNPSLCAPWYFDWKFLKQWLLLPASFMIAIVAACGLLSAANAQPPTQYFVPAGDLQTIFERNRAGVLLPRAEFQKLLQQARDASQQLSELPSASVIRSATYQVSLANQHALVQLDLDIQQYADAWVSLPLVVGNLAVEEATIGGTPAALGRSQDSSDTLTLVHRNPGRFTLTLKMSTPLGSVGSDSVAAFRLLPKVPSAMSVKVPANQHLEWNGLKLDRPAELTESAQYQIPVGNHDNVRLKWTSQQQQTDTDSLVFARTQAVAQLTGDSLRWESETRLSVFGQSINQVVARVPAALEITAVDSTGLESWTLEDDPDQPGFTSVLLNYRQPFSQDRVVQISAVAAVPRNQAYRLPTLQLPNVTAHTGRLLIRQQDQLRLLATVGGGARQLSVSEDAAAAAQGEVFDFWLQDFDVSVRVRPRDRELFAEIQSALDIQETSARLTWTAAVETLNAPLFELDVRLPPAWQIQQVTDDRGHPLKWRTTGNDSSDADDGAGTSIVLEPPTAISAGGLLNVSMELSRSISDPTAPQNLTLPVLQIPEALVVGGTYQISAASDLTVAPQEMNGLSPVGIDGAALLFESQSTQWSGQLLVSRRPARLSSRSVLRSWMDARQKSTEAVVTVDVVQGTTRSLQLLIPSDWGSAVRFEVLSVQPVPGISDQAVPAEVSVLEQTIQPAADNQQSVQLTFDQRFVGAVTLGTLVQQPRTPETELSAPFVKTVGAVRQHGLIVFEAYPEQQLTAAADPATSGLQPADASLVDAPSAASGRRVALVYRFVQPDYQLVLQETRYDTQAVPSAVCEAIHNISVLSDQGAIQREARIVVQCVGVQTLRFTLPDADNSFLWSTMFNDTAVEVRRDGNQYLVAIPAGLQQTRHELNVLFETSVPQTSVLGQTTQDSLQLAIDTDRQQAAPINVLEQTWEVRYPSSAMLLNYDGGFLPQTELQQAGWLQSVRSLFRAPKWNDLGDQLTVPGLLLLVLFVFTALIVRRRWKSLLGLLLVAAAVMLIALSMLSLGGRTPSRVMSKVSPQASFDSLAMEAADVQLPEQETDDLFGPAGGMGMGGSGFEINGSSMGMGSLEVAPGAVAPPEPSLPKLVEPAAPPTAADAAPSDDIGRTELSVTQVPPVSNNVSPQGNADVATDPFAVAAGDVFQKSGRQKQGDARLSVRAHVVAPADFQKQQFRSIGDSAQSGVLEVVIQRRSQLNALRLTFAAIVVLLCFRMSRLSFSGKLTLAVILFFGAAAAVALVPNQWQSAVDGIVLGTAAGVMLWMIMAVVRLLSICCRAIRRRNCCGWFRSASAASVLVMMSSLLAHTTPTAAQDSPATDQQQPNASAKPQKHPIDPLLSEMVLPYDEDRPALMAERVFLPREDFLKLYRLANPDQLPHETSAVPAHLDNAAVVAAFYVSQQLRQVRETQWSQSIRVRYVIRNFTDTAQSVLLPLGNVAVREAQLNGNDAVLLAAEVPSPPVIPDPPTERPLQDNTIQQQQQQQPLPADSKMGNMKPGAGDRAYAVRIPDKGLHLLDVVFEVAATVENSVGQLTLPLQPVAAGTLQFELPAADLEARINGRSNTFRKDQAMLTVPLTSAGSLRIDWRPKTTSTVADSIYHSTVHSALELSDAGLTHHATITINVRQGQLSEVDLTIPTDYAVQQVQGTDVAGWNQPEQDSSQLKMVLRQPIDGETQIRLTLFKAQTFSTADTNLEVPVPAVQGASRDSGSVVVLAGRELEVRTAALSGVTQFNAADATLPVEIRDALRPVLAWRYTRHPAAITVRAFRTADRLQVTVLNGVQLEAQRQLWTTQVNAQITGSPQRRLKLKVPSDFLALSVNATSLADWYLTDPAAAEADADADGNPNANAADYRILNVQFTAASVGKVDVVVQGQTGRTSDANVARLVAPQVLSADAADTQVSVWLDAASEIASSEADSWKRSGSERTIDPRILKLRPQAPDISFTSALPDPGSIVLNLRQAPASLVAESVLVTNVTDTSLELTLGLNWKISRAATRELQFVLPAGLADVLDFRIAGLRLLQREPMDDGVRLTVHLQQPVSDRFFVMGTGTLPLPPSRQIAPQPAEFVVREASLASIASQAHFAVLVNQSSGLLQLQNGSRADENVSADELTTRIPQGFLEQSVAIRRLRTDQPNPVWNLQFPAQQPVSPAVVSLAAHTTVIAMDGTWRSRHSLQVRNESRQFLPVRLPQNTQVLYCLVRSTPTRMVTRMIAGNGGEDQVLHLIPVPQSGEVSTAFEVEFGLSGSLSPIDEELVGRTLQVPVPEFPEYRDDREFGITVSRNTWSVYVPKSWQVALLDDPRLTSVIPASAQDFQDVALMSAVDDVRSMLSSLAAPYVQDSSGGFVWMEIQKQKQMLGASRGNSAAAETERAAALQQLEAAESELQLLQQPTFDVDRQAAGTSGQLRHPQANRFLERVEESQNDYNASNSLGLLLNNTDVDGPSVGNGLVSDGQRADSFNFVLPQEQKDAGSFGRKISPDTREKTDRPKAEEPQSRSQLLDRRKSIVQQQTDKLQMQKGQSTPPAQQMPQRNRQVRQQNIQGASEPAGPVPGGDPAGLTERQLQSVQPAGALSLIFQIPDGGVRYDFVRTGGNPALTLTVRSSSAIQTVLRLAWAAACLLVAVLLIRAASRSRGDLLLQVLVVTCVVGLAGWLTLPHPLRVLPLLLCLGSAAATSLLVIIRSFTNRGKAAVRSQG